MYPRRAVHFLSITATTTLLVTPTFGGSLQKSRVAADAQWLAHMDVQAVVASTVGRAILEPAVDPNAPANDADPAVKLKLQLEIDSEQVNDMFEAMKGELHLDLRKDIRDVTIYGTGNPENPANVVAVFTTSENIDRLANKVREEAPEYNKFAAGGYDLETFRGEDGETVFFHVRTAALSSDRIVLLSGDSERLVRSIAVVDGKLPNLAGSASPSFEANPQPGSFFFVASNRLDWVEDEEDPGSEIIRRAQGLRIDMGESGDSMYLDGSLATANTEDAQNLTDVLQGLAAMARLAAGAEPDLAPFKELVRSFNVTQQDNTITIKMRHKTDKLVNALSLAAENDRRKKAAGAKDEEADDDDE